MIMVRYLFLLVLLLPLPSLAEECPRIISQSPYITHTLEWMGLKDCIVGTSRYDKLDLPTTGGVYDPDAEAIDDLMPDIIFTSTWTKPEVLKSVTPKGAKAYRLKGLQSMAEIEENIRIIAMAVNRKSLYALADDFGRQWRAAASRIKAGNKRILLISSCSGMPYSFGQHTWLYDLFTQAGFNVVETAERIRHISPGNEITEITQLLDTFQPDMLFIFQRKLSTQCQMLTPKIPVRIHSFDGELFLHPAPVLLKGMAELEKLNPYL
jgi:ABC-type hemin transport system substrate-binding protein